MLLSHATTPIPLPITFPHVRISALESHRCLAGNQHLRCQANFVSAGGHSPRSLQACASSPLLKFRWQVKSPAEKGA